MQVQEVLLSTMCPQKVSVFSLILGSLNLIKEVFNIDNCPSVNDSTK